MKEVCDILTILKNQKVFEDKAIIISRADSQKIINHIKNSDVEIVIHPCSNLENQQKKPKIGYNVNNKL
jgi:hypothetical protein